MTILQNTSVVGGSSSNFAPNYLDGAILANDDEFFLYGFVMPSFVSLPFLDTVVIDAFKLIFTTLAVLAGI
jgi:hypothetical protein